MSKSYSSSSSSSTSRPSVRRSSDSLDDDVRLLLDWHHVGAIIGKSGATVKQIREQSGCSINIIAPSSSIPAPQQIDRIMTMRGSIQQVSKAIYLIANTIQARIAERKKAGDAINGARNQANAAGGDDATQIKLLVHRAAVGAVIGKGGESIRATQADTGARIQVSQDALGNSTDKTVTISGTPDVVQAAVAKVLQQLEESPLRAGTKTVPFVPGPYYAQNDRSSSSSSSSSSSAPAPSVSSSSSSASASGPISIQKIAIPTICAGCVIGRNGTIIRDLRAQSGTNISIADPDPATPDERVVTITGSPSGIQSAVFLIRQCVESYVPPSHADEENQDEQANEQQ